MPCASVEYFEFLALINNQDKISNDIIITAANYVTSYLERKWSHNCSDKKRYWGEASAARGQEFILAQFLERRSSSKESVRPDWNTEKCLRLQQGLWDGRWRGRLQKRQQIPSPPQNQKGPSSCERRATQYYHLIIAAWLEGTLWHIYVWKQSFGHVSQDLRWLWPLVRPISMAINIWKLIRSIKLNFLFEIKSKFYCTN